MAIDANPPSSAREARLDIQTLLNARAYPHPVTGPELVETHISWVLLTGSYAYKLKKPVNLGFLDFSTLELRHRACLEELRLNRRFAPELYLEVVPVSGPADAPVIGGAGPAIEYAVKMREFPQAAQLDRLLAAGQLSPADIDALAASIAEFHKAAPRSSADGPYSSPEAVRKAAHDNLARLLPRTETRTHERLESLAKWTRARGESLSDLMTARRRAGFVRELHGDLHLGNLARVGSRMVPFDCIEFSAELRWIDVISDLAFLTMDLHFRDRSDLAYRVLNRYLESTGDYAGVRLLRYFEVYRALVRAKVALIRGDGSAGEIHAAQARNLDRYVRLAEQRCQSEGPAMILMHGMSGSGKTWLSEQLMSTVPAVRVRSDIERKRLHGVEAAAGSGSPLMGGLYAPAESARTYDLLAEAATSILKGGENVIVDAAFLRRADRLRFRDLARTLDVPYAIASCHAPVSELDRRVADRARAAADASEADRAVLERQLATAEPLTEDELPAALLVETGDPAQVNAIIASLKAELMTDVRIGTPAIGSQADPRTAP